jgi:hypothetical protein
LQWGACRSLILTGDEPTREAAMAAFAKSWRRK